MCVTGADGWKAALLAAAVVGSLGRRSTSTTSWASVVLLPVAFTLGGATMEAHTGMQPVNR